MKKLEYKLTYLKNWKELVTYKNIKLVGSFANWTEDGKSNVGFQAINADGLPRRFRYDSVQSIELMH
jgi:hypothetical protein